MQPSNYFFSDLLNNLKETVESVAGLGPAGGIGGGSRVFIGVPEREPGADVSAYLFVNNGAVNSTTLSGLVMGPMVTVRIYQRYRGGSRENVELAASDLAYRVLFAIAKDNTLKGSKAIGAVRTIDPTQLNLTSQFSGDFQYRVFDINVSVTMDVENIF